MFEFDTEFHRLFQFHELLLGLTQRVKEAFQMYQLAR